MPVRDFRKNSLGMSRVFRVKEGDDSGDRRWTSGVPGPGNRDPERRARTPRNRYPQANGKASRRPPRPGVIFQVEQPGQEVTLNTWQFLTNRRTVENQSGGKAPQSKEVLGFCLLWSAALFRRFYFLCCSLPALAMAVSSLFSLGRGGEISALCPVKCQVWRTGFGTMPSDYSGDTRILIHYQELARSMKVCSLRRRTFRLFGRHT
jgi:hypothetical protein